ncbi:EF-hand calcium-binding domain-containing protein 6-like, partial [Rhopilema esculentum]|uniref:EF-hand calcium-binding domain-containing protein 6-like n=1 Tax=Rhopilema esculentum TaxID=499914 RepID=UPI0031D68451
MASTRVIPTPVFGDPSDLQPNSMLLQINERPLSRRRSTSPRILSPRNKSSEIRNHIISSNERDIRKNSLRRSNTNPDLPSQRTFPWSEPNANFERRIVSSSAGGIKRQPGPAMQAGNIFGILKAENIIRENVRRKYSDMREAFQMLDVGHNQTVTLENFRRVIHAFCLQLADDQFEHLLLKIGTKDNGVINYVAFLEKFRVGPVMMSEPQRFAQTTPRTSDGRSDSFEFVETKLREKLAAQLDGFMKAVRLFDYNRDGHVQRNELKRILDNCCFKLQEIHFNKLIQKYVISQNPSSIDYMDLLRRLGIEPKSTEQRLKTPVTKSLFLDQSNSRQSNRVIANDLQGLSMGQIERKFREKVLIKFKDLKRAFVAFDKKKDGCVTLDELKRILTHFVFQMSDQLFAQIMERCGIRATHKIPYDHFLDKFKHSPDEGNGQTIPIKPSHKVNPIREAESPLEMKDVWELLRSHIMNSYSSIKRAFLAFDDDKDGRVRRKEFRKILDSFLFRISDEQFKQLMYRVDPEGKGYVSYHGFLQTFEVKEGKGAHPWLNGERKLNQTKPLAAMNTQMAEEILRDKIMDNWKTMAKAFMRVDENADGFISKHEMMNLLNRYHLSMTDEHFQQLWGKCDENRDGRIQYKEFLNNLGVDITSGDLKGISTRITDESEEKIQLMKTDQLSRQQVASKNALSRTTKMNASEVIDVLRDHIRQRSTDLRKTFSNYDYDGDGKLSKKEFRMTLQNLGLLMHDDQFKELTNRLGFFKGTMSFSDFIHKFEDLDKFGEGGKTLHMNNHRYNKVKERSETMTAEEVEKIMRNKISESFQTLRQAFYAVDANHDAQITRPEFRRLLDSFMIPIDDYEFERLMSEKLKVPKNGTISYRDFIGRFQHDENFEKGHPWLFSHQSPNVTYSPRDLTAQEAHACLKEKANDQWHDISAAFRAFDKDGNSIVTKEELKTVLHRFNISIDQQEFKKLWRLYDTDRNGHVDHREFLQRLGVELAPGDVNGISNKITKGSEDEIYRHHQSQQMKQHKAAINQANTTSFMTAIDVEKQLRDKFRDSYESFRKAFEQVDKNKDGFISRSELMKVLYDHHYYMDDSELAVLLSRLGFGNKDSLSYGNFLSAFQDPRHSRNPRLTLDSRSSNSTSVSFESGEDLSPDEALIKLRNKVANNSEAIASAFAAFDKSETGRINVSDLHMIINSFCFKLSEKQFKHLLTKLSAHPDGTVDYESFIQSFQRTDAEASKTWLENALKDDVKILSPRSTAQNSPPSYEILEEQIGDMIQAKYRKISKILSDLDFDGNGQIQPHSLRKVLNEHTLRLSDDQFSQLWSKFDQNREGSINYKDFLNRFSGQYSPRDLIPRNEENILQVASPRRPISPSKNQVPNHCHRP